MLVDYVSSIETATEFAVRFEKDEVCMMLGKVQQLVNEAMQSFIKASSPGDRGRGVQGQLDAEVWEEINASCIEHQEFWLAQICALHVIVLPDELEELIGSYE